MINPFLGVKTLESQIKQIRPGMLDGVMGLGGSTSASDDVAWNVTVDPGRCHSFLT